MKRSLLKPDAREKGPIMRELEPAEIKHIELSILLEFDRICSEHKLTYLLAYGTALGAARHGGFIPWDDDIDVVMPREDYERFFEIVSSGKVSTQLVLTSYRDKSSVYNFFKLTDPRTIVNETYLLKEFTSGLWIDIFPIERVLSEDPVEAAWRACSRKLFVAAQRVSNPNEGTSASARLIKKLIWPLFRLFNPYKLAQSVELKARSLNRSADEVEGRDCQWACMNDLSAEGCRCGNDMLFPSRTLRFEGHELPVPRSIDTYLTHYYGDWHQYPPESQRHSHFPKAYLKEA